QTTAIEMARRKRRESRSDHGLAGRTSCVLVVARRVSGRVAVRRLVDVRRPDLAACDAVRRIDTRATRSECMNATGASRCAWRAELPETSIEGVPGCTPLRCLPHESAKRSLTELARRIVLNENH